MLGSLICSINRLMSIDIEGTSLSVFDCAGNPVMFDENAITKLAKSLPAGGGTLTVDETGLHEIIQPICAAKNWTIEKVKYNYEPFN